MDDSLRDKLIEAISSEVESYWAERQQPLLFSQLGPLLTTKGFNFHEIIRPLRLSQFIEVYCSKRCRIIRHPVHPPKVGVLPRSAEVSEDRDELVKLFERKPSATQQIGKLFSRAVWAAFIKAIKSGHRRYIKIDSDPLVFAEFPTSSIPDASIYIEIPQNAVLEGFNNSTADKDRVAAAIEKWASNHGISSERLLQHGSTELVSSQRGGALAELMQLLSEEELRRIVIPLDILKKLI